MKLIFEKSVPGRRAFHAGPSDVPTTINIRKALLREKTAELPELSELDVVRHFTALSRRNFGVDTNFYPLGSCTMKYNPKVTERIASYPGFTHLHPLLPQLRMGRYGGIYDAAYGRCARRAYRYDDYGGVPSRQGQRKDDRAYT